MKLLMFFLIALGATNLQAEIPECDIWGQNTELCTMDGKVYNPLEKSSLLYCKVFSDIETYNNIMDKDSNNKKYNASLCE